MTNRLIDPLVVPVETGDCCCAMKGAGAGGGTGGGMFGILPTGAAATGDGAGTLPGAGTGAVCAAHAVATATREIAAARATLEPERVYLSSSHKFAVRAIDFEDMVLSVERYEENCKPYAMRSEPNL
jgi:hypothetical protein